MRNNKKSLEASTTSVKTAVLTKQPLPTTQEQLHVPAVPPTYTESPTATVSEKNLAHQKSKASNPPSPPVAEASPQVPGAPLQHDASFFLEKKMIPINPYFQKFFAKPFAERKALADNAMKDEKGEVGITTHMITVCIKEFLESCIKDIKIFTASLAPQLGVVPQFNPLLARDWCSQPLKDLCESKEYQAADYVCLTLATSGGRHAVPVIISKKDQKIYCVDSNENKIGENEALDIIAKAQLLIPQLQSSTVVIAPQRISQQTDLTSCGLYTFLNSVGLVLTKENAIINLGRSTFNKAIFLPVIIETGEGLLPRSTQNLEIVAGIMNMIYTDFCEKEARPKHSL